MTPRETQARIKNARIKITEGLVDLSDVIKDLVNELGSIANEAHQWKQKCKELEALARETKGSNKTVPNTGSSGSTQEPS